MDMNVKAMAMECELNKWAEIIQACEESGMRVFAWCDAHGVSRKMYYYWQRQLREKAWRGTMALDMKTTESEAEGPVFAELPLELASEGAQLELTIHFSKCHVDVYRGAGAGTINSVVEALSKL